MDLPRFDVFSRLLAVLALIGINAFFVAAEFSIVSVRRSRINQLVANGDVPAQAVQRFQRSIERLLSTTQIGITLSSLALGWIGENTMAVILLQGLDALPLPTPIVHAVTHSVAVLLAFITIAYLQIVLGELCPKAVALLYPEQLARFLGAPSLTIARLFMPFIWILNQSTRCLLRLVGIDYQGSQSWHSRLTPEELHLIIQTSTESAGFDADERELLKNVFEFRDVTVDEVMVPRTQIEALPKTATLQDLLDVIVATGYTQFPVINESLDDVMGVIRWKDLVEPLAGQQITPHSPISAWVYPTRFVTKSTQLHSLLQIMKRSGQSMVMILDEFGGTAGLVTRQDVIAEIIGDQHDSETFAHGLIQALEGDCYRIQAQISMAELNEQLNLALPDQGEYQTLAGFLIHQLHAIPEVGDYTCHSGWQWMVSAMEGLRVVEVRAQQLSSIASPAATVSPETTEPLSPKLRPLNLE
ncbi:MAG: hemolysin family protein [Cyanobacteria bacterium]|nr:hemolysin family protein [Cyanobacteriota bacterium]MDA0866639.1 hemolysin family protein [Cyanobacteriota bacterium]